MEIKSNPKSKGHLTSHSPSKSPPTSRSHSKSPTPRPQVVTKSPSTHPNTNDQPPLQKLPEVHTLIDKLEGISISQEKTQHSELLYEGSVSSYLPTPHILTRYQSDKFGITPFEFPFPSH